MSKLVQPPPPPPNAPAAPQAAAAPVVPPPAKPQPAHTALNGGTQPVLALPKPPPPPPAPPKPPTLAEKADHIRPPWRPRKFENGEQLWERFLAYRQHELDNPHYEAKAFSGKDGVVHTSLPKMKALTLTGFCLYIGTNLVTWGDWRRNRTDLADAITAIEQAIQNDKFTGAAAGLLHASIISRDLGLVDRQAMDVTVEPPQPPRIAADVANTIHPDDPDPLGENRPLFSLNQLQAGIPFFEPKK